MYRTQNRKRLSGNEEGKGRRREKRKQIEGEECLPGSDPQHQPLPAWPAAALETLAGTLECPCAVQGAVAFVTAVCMQHSRQRYGLRPDCSADPLSLSGQELVETLQEIKHTVTVANLVNDWPGDSWLW